MGELKFISPDGGPEISGYVSSHADVIAEALRRMAGEEWQRAETLMSFGRHFGLYLPVLLDRVAEHEARAQIYADWARALELQVSVDFIRYGCSRSDLA